MEIIQIIWLAIIQGITEFLPISSSAHLILLPLLTYWQDQGLAIDVAAHFGSLVAVLHYLRSEVCQLFYAGINSVRTQSINNQQEQLFWLIGMASIPVLLIGFLTHDLVSTYLRNPLVIAAASIVFGFLLLYADKTGKRINGLNEINLKSALWVGLAQVLALIPGTSRSGITMTVALMLGFDRKSAAKFSFLLAIPVVVCAAGYESLSLLKLDNQINQIHFALTSTLSAVTAWLSIHLFLRFLDKVGMLPFVIYRVLLGVFLIVIFI